MVRMVTFPPNCYMADKWVVGECNYIKAATMNFTASSLKIHITVSSISLD
jgi:hypothetical protein